MRSEMSLELSCHSSMGSENPDARFLSTNAKPRYAPDRHFLPLHVRLDAKVDVKKKHMEAVCSTEIELFEKPETIYFDAAELNISKVMVNGKPVKFTLEKEKMVVPVKHVAKKGKVEIHYSISNPKLGIFFIHPTKDRPDKPFQAWTHSEAFDARFWYPCQNLPETKNSIEMHITVQSPFKVIANGDLISTKTDKKSGWITYSWKLDAPNPSYLNAFMIGDFAEVKDKFGKTDVTYYCERGKEEDIQRSFGNTPKMMKFFSEFTGYLYPHKKYAQVAVADFIYGGMEHTTCTTQTDVYLQDAIAHEEYPYPGEMLAAHELAHQWFGDLLTCRDWAHGWLNESFATYFEALWMQQALGKEEFLYEMLLNAQAYLDEDGKRYRRPIVTNTYVEPSDIFDRHLYEKGACVLHSIRNILGEEAFKKAIRYYVETNAHQSVITEDLLTAIRKSTGKNLTQFFDEFVYRGGHPELRIDCHYDRKKHLANMRVIQTQQGELYHFPVTIAVTQSNGKVVKFVKEIGEKEHRFEFKLQQEPKNMVFDSEYAVLKITNMTKPRGMWHYQLKNDENIVHRMAAAYELAKYASEGDLKALQEAMTSDPFWGMRGETALALGSTKLPQAMDMIMHAAEKESNHRVQRAMIQSLSNCPVPETREFMLRQMKREDSYIIPAEAFRSFGKWKDPRELEILSMGLQRDSWAQIIAGGAIDGIGAMQTREAMQKLLSLLHSKYNDRIRMTAARNLGQVGKGREEVLWKLIETTKDPYINLQISAISALGELGDMRALPMLEEMQKGHRDPRIPRSALEAIRKINGVLELPKFGASNK